MRDGDVGVVAARNQSERCVDVGRNVLHQRGDPAHGSVGKQVHRLNRCCFFSVMTSWFCNTPTWAADPSATEQGHHSIGSGTHRTEHPVGFDLGGPEDVEMVGAESDADRVGDVGTDCFIWKPLSPRSNMRHGLRAEIHHGDQVALRLDAAGVAADAALPPG